MAIVLAGKTCSGKSTIVNKLVSIYGFNRIITYTNRPKRKGEKDDIDYHFITTKDFKKKIEEGFFAEWKSYDTEFGTWYYGSALEDLENAEDNTIVILTPDGYRDVCEKLEKKPICIYIYANNSTITKRLLARGDDKEEAVRRLEHDNEDFKDFEYEADKIFHNNDGYKLDEVIEKILKFVR